MTITLFDRNSPYLIYGIPALMILSCVAIAQSPLLQRHPEFATAITIDLTISTPLIYLLLIWKSNIPKITAVPLFTGGIFLTSYLLPVHQQTYLDLVKFWLLPIIEVSVLAFISFSAYKIFKSFNSSKRANPDMYTVLRITCAKIVDQYVSPQLVVNRVLTNVGKKPLKLKWYIEALACEMAGLYYGLFSWKGFKPNKTTFTYHKNSGVTVLFGIIMFLLAAETLVLHVVVQRWSVIAAWVLTVPSLYFVFQIFAHVKAIYQRPIEILDDKLIIRYGLFGETEIRLENIEKIEFSTLPLSAKEGVRQVSLVPGLEQFNTILRLKEYETYCGWMGFRSEYRTLLLFVDENARLKKQIEQYESH